MDSIMVVPDACCYHREGASSLEPGRIDAAAIITLDWIFQTVPIRG
ncbi:MAG: hypothetical protein ACR2F9_09940 [Longimicrobiaceae bacterium]